MLSFSIIIPVYNRPFETAELLESIVNQAFSDAFEVLVIEDGSTQKSDLVVVKYQKALQLRYFFKENSGAGLTRNFGMQRATGNYFIILDSDTLLPTHYLAAVKRALIENYTDAFGGADAAHKNFTPLQKAINYSMTALLTTGGIRGKKRAVGKFQPRSFNFGISKQAFLKTGGFSKAKTGEDIDLTFRLWQNGFQTQWIKDAFVYHKRRTTLLQFFWQTFAFGMARPRLNKHYPNTAKITYWFPSFFIVGFFVSVVLTFLGYWQFSICYGFYFGFIFIDSLFQNKKIAVALWSIITSFIQFFGYGLGFLKTTFFKR